jgi:hypothetical protein
MRRKRRTTGAGQAASASSVFRARAWLAQPRWRPRRTEMRERDGNCGIARGGKGGRLGIGAVRLGLLVPGHAHGAALSRRASWIE